MTLRKRKAQTVLLPPRNKDPQTVSMDVELSKPSRIAFTFHTSGAFNIVIDGGIVAQLGAGGGTFTSYVLAKGKHTVGWWLP